MSTHKILCARLQPISRNPNRKFPNLSRLSKHQRHTNWVPPTPTGSTYGLHRLHDTSTSDQMWEWEPSERSTEVRRGTERGLLTSASLARLWHEKFCRVWKVLKL